MSRLPVPCRSATTTASTGGRKPLTFGVYGPGGITLGEAREKLGDAKKMIAAGGSPARKSRGEARINAGETFSEWAVKWLDLHKMADSTRDMRRSVYERDVKPKPGEHEAGGDNARGRAPDG